MLKKISRTSASEITSMLRDRRGASAVEFALVAPLLFSMVAGVIQYGSMLFTYNQMLDTARNSAREMAVGSATKSETESKANGKKVGWVKNGKWDVDADDSDPDEVTTSITVEGTEAAVIDLLPMPAELTVSVTMEKEG